MGARQGNENAESEAIEHLVQITIGKGCQLGVNIDKLKYDIDAFCWKINKNNIASYKLKCAEIIARYRELEEAALSVARLRDRSFCEVAAAMELAIDERYRIEVWCDANVELYSNLQNKLISLVDIFERHFERNAGACGDAKDGPFVRFCLYVLNEYNQDPARKHYEPATIVRAFREYRKRHGAAHDELKGVRQQLKTIK
jgi:hypothetical protein